MEIFKNNKKFIFFIGFYLLVHALIRLVISDTIQVDDREQIIFAQELLLGYQMPQPPLYSWASWFLFQIFGTGLFALTLLKYLLILITFFVIWKIGRITFENDQLAQLLLMSFLLMPSFFWHMHQGFTHTILLSLGIVLSIFAFLKLNIERTFYNYIFFGIAISIGLLGKYSYLIFLIIFTLAGLSSKYYRHNILNWKILISLLVIIVIAGPHLYWLLNHFSEIYPEINNRLNISNENQNILLTQIKIFTNYIGFIFPLMVFFIAPIFKTKITEVSNHKNLIFIRFIFVALVLSIILPIFFDIPHIKVRWLHPIMMMFPFFAISLINEKWLTGVSRRWFTYTLLILSIFVVLIRISQPSLGPKLGFYPRLSTPIVETIKKIPTEEIRHAQIYTDNINLLAHLIVWLPENKILYKNKIFNDQPKENSSICIEMKDTTLNFPLKNNKDSSYKVYETVFGQKIYRISTRRMTNCQ